MNLLLLESKDMQGEQRARITTARQLRHIHETLKLKKGDTFVVGKLNGKIGSACITHLDSAAIEAEIEWQNDPPPAIPLTLVIALPRPKMLKRIVQTATTMGVKQIFFINAWKVEKSYWQSPWLTEEKLYDNCVLGLEQAKDTVLPEIHQKKLFKPFVEDELPELVRNTRNLVAHPGSATPCPVNIGEPCTLAIGPEGGFTPYEIEKLIESGFEPVHLGQRILRVETAVPALTARLFCHD